MTRAVTHMGAGIVRLVPTRGAAVTRALERFGGYLLERHGYPGRRDYVLGLSGEDSADRALVGRSDYLSRDGWDPGEVPLFPLADDLHEQADRDDGQPDGLAAAGAASRRGRS